MKLGASGTLARARPYPPEPGERSDEVQSAIDAVAVRTERLPPGEPDMDAVSFALERDRALQRSEHSASVRRMRRALSVGIWFWLAGDVFDLWVAGLEGSGSLAYFLTLDGIAAALAFAAIWRLGRPVEPSPRALLFIDLGIFTLTSVLVSLMCLRFRGISSPYATGVILILVARGAATLAPWQQGAWLFGIPALSFPLTMLIASRFDPEIAAQLRDPEQLGFFAIQVAFIVGAWLILTLSGDFAWRLRREALETRNIGRYALERRLATGGMGAVWVAYDHTLKQRVALKTVRAYQQDSVAVARLEREVRALAELTHPNTVRVFDYGATDDGLWYYAMELLHGENLRELVTREGPLEAGRAIRIVCQVLRALGEAHGKGIIHRDIKPDNVFVAELGGESDFAKLLDFGIAKATMHKDATLTNTGWLTGTPAYLPPEVLLGGAADVRSDIYSLGATLYFALSAKLPFPQDNHQALFAALLEGQPALLSLVTPRPIPPALERIVHRCMAKNPNERPCSTKTLLDELQPMLVET